MGSSIIVLTFQKCLRIVFRVDALSAINKHPGSKKKILTNMSSTIMTVTRLVCLQSRIFSRSIATCRRYPTSESATMPLPQEDLTKGKVYPEKIAKIVDDISKLSLLEVADLNELLKV